MCLEQEHTHVNSCRVDVNVQRVYTMSKVTIIRYLFVLLSLLLFENLTNIVYFL
jgi:hypothetical protein